MRQEHRGLAARPHEGRHPGLREEGLGALPRRHAQQGVYYIILHNYINLYYTILCYVILTYIILIYVSFSFFFSLYALFFSYYTTCISYYHILYYTIFYYILQYFIIICKALGPERLTEVLTDLLVSLLLVISYQLILINNDTFSYSHAYLLLFVIC